MRFMLVLVSVALVASASGQAVRPAATPQADQYRVVRFHVKAGQERAFERFFTESLLPAARRLTDSPEALARELEAFTVLRPTTVESGAPSTYYVIYRSFEGAAGARGEAMRDMVRRAFPPEEAERRVQQWMSTIDLESLVPQGQTFERVAIGAGGLTAPFGG